jgi:hypothetical protein
MAEKECSLFNLSTNSKMDIKQQDKQVYTYHFCFHVEKFVFETDFIYEV